MILIFGTSAKLPVTRNGDKELISIGPYVFTRQNFYQLIDYVIQGGYPKWQDGIAPGYVIKMREAVFSPGPINRP